MALPGVICGRRTVFIIGWSGRGGPVSVFAGANCGAERSAQSTTDYGTLSTADFIAHSGTGGATDTTANGRIPG